MVTLNRSVFAQDPTGFRIPNDGVARVGLPTRPHEWDVLRWELQSFVCEGEYRVGLERILDTYLSRLNEPRQPAAWVSGFYGSGKSHLVRVLDALWRDVTLPDSASARGLARVSREIADDLQELSGAARREGGLWSAAGTLSTGVGSSVRLAILAIVFRAGGLPEKFHQARFLLWLQQEQALAAVEAHLGSHGRTLATELPNMYVSPSLAEALIASVPGLPGSSEAVHGLLQEQYPTVTEIGSDELVDTLLAVVRQHSADVGRLPLVLLVLDELQQFLAEDPKRTLEVQDIVERCSAELEGRLLVVGTGQMQLGSTPALQKLRDRFAVSVALSDSDVDRVVRAVVLRKDPARMTEVGAVLGRASGEISRHLGGTKIAARGEDAQDLAADYPLLPTRRRFWEAVLRSVDSAGRAGQLRAQLRIVLEATQAVAALPLGHVIPADAIYDPILADLQQTGVLPRDTATLIASLEEGSGVNGLKARIAKLAFLIARLEEGGPLATGVRATADAFADLLVDDLLAGGAEIRAQVPPAIAEMVSQGVLLEVEGQYVLQTPVAAEWLQDFQRETARLRNDDVWQADRRSQVIRTAVVEQIGRAAFQQGKAKITRRVTLSFGDSVPTSASGEIPVWVRDGWSTTGAAMQDEARAAGVDSPAVFVFIPRSDADAIRDALSAQTAALNVVQARPTPATDEGLQAQAGITSRGQTAGTRLTAAVIGLLNQARVFQGGGNEMTGATLKDGVEAAATASLSRLFPRFAEGDDPAWGKVADRAKQGAANPLGALGHGGDPDKQPVCAEALRFLAGDRRTGKDVRTHFMAGDYGWPQDTVDGALYALVATGLVRAWLNGSPVGATAIPQNSLGSCVFQAETIVVPASVRIEVKGMAARLGIAVAGLADAQVPGRIIDALLSLADTAGGDPPLPPVPSREALRDLQGLPGNEQTIRIHDLRADLLAQAESWKALAERKAGRLVAWGQLHDLLLHAEDSPDRIDMQAQVAAILAGRRLLEDPDPVGPLVVRLAALLRARYAATRDAYERARSDAVAALDKDPLWAHLEPPQRAQLLVSLALDGQYLAGIETTDRLLSALTATEPREWEERIDALPMRIARAREQAAKLLEPAAVRVVPPPATIRTADDLDAYLTELRAIIEAKLGDGPVVL